ncbi:galactose-binding protein, partial [Riemerella anatipestifer]|nr:galactose-binding protein [Riemerella anatipestifer]MDY3507333.1 galactose-binding protein [Riemerella anatipestifer]
FRVSKVFTFIKNDYQGKEIFPHIYGATDVRKVKLEKGNKATGYTPAPEDTHYITISGNTDEITNLQTNAEELWSL